MIEYDPEQEKMIKKWIENNFPVIGKKIPPNSVFSDFGSRKMISSHDLAGLGNWLSSSGFPRFVRDPEIPDGFFACGIHRGTASESLLVMWKDHDRYFWFNNMYVMYMGENTGLSVRATNANLDQAISRWNEGMQHVILLMGTFHEWDPDL